MFARALSGRRSVRRSTDCQHQVTRRHGGVGFGAERLEPRVLLATVTGIKFNDLDGDGIRDAAEPALGNWVIYHDLDNDNVRDAGEAFDTTNASGAYVLNFPAGSGIGGTIPTPEVIREVPQAGWRVTLPAAGEHTLALASASNVNNINFGNTERGLVTGAKFNDLDLDGTRDATEPNLQGWTVYADLNNDSNLDRGEPADVTDASGNYSLNLAPAATPYVIREVLEAGWAQTAPAGGSYSVTLSAGQVATGRNFGNTQRALISGTKFNDVDGDRLRDAGEPGLANWRIFIDSNNDGNFDAGEPSDLTAANGNYAFTVNASTTAMTLREENQAGWRPSTPSGFILVVSAGDGIVRNFGNTQLGQVTGFKFLDANANGVRDAGELGLEGWTIYGDVNGNGQLDAGEPSDVTGSNGGYAITLSHLPTPRSYTVREVLQPGWRATSPAGGHAVTFTGPGQVFVGRDFLNTDRRVISGIKYNDRNGDGDRDVLAIPGEPALAGWRIYADLDNDNVFDLTEPSDLTDVSGAYTLIVPPGTADVTVREVVQADWRQTQPGGTGEYAVSVPNGGTVTGRNFGNTQLALITGQKINDLDGDGVRDILPLPGEPGLAGWTIYVDADNDNLLDATETRDVTDTTGRYSFAVTGLPTGSLSYTVREVLQTGWRATNPATGERVVTITGLGQTRSGIDFLNTRRPQVSGLKFNDLDADAVRDAGEDGLEGWTIYHDEDNDGTLDAGEASTVTPADGTYELALPPGTPDLARLYRVREVEQVRWRQTFPVTNGGAQLVSLLPGETIANRNFGNTRRALVSGMKYEDENGDGDRDAGEPGLGGFRIYADYNDNGVLDADEDSVLTAADGSYSFDVSVPLIVIIGRPSVTIREVIPAGWNPINPAQGAHALTVLSGGVVTGRDFGNARFVTITGRKFHDLDADGLDDATEPGLGNWRVFVDSNNNGVFDTDSNTLEPASGLPDTTSNTAVTRSRIDVTGQLPVLTDVNVRLSITHPTVNDLEVALISPRGTRINLFSNVGGTTDNITNVLLDEDSANQFATTPAPYANEALNPEGNLAALEGQDPNGQWTLEVVDNGTADGGTADTGSLTDFQLILASAEPSALTATAGVVGNYAISGLRPGTHVVREVRQAGWFPTAPVSAARTVTLNSGVTRPNVDFGNGLPGSISGRKWEDRDGDGVIDAGEVGLAGWVIFRDLDNDGIMDTFNRRFDSAANAPIRDATTFPPPLGTFPGITSSVLPVSAPDGLIIDLNVSVNITHARIADLTLSLISPSGTSITLTGDLVAAGANMNTTFDDSAPTPIGAGTPPYTGVFRPAQPLGNFIDDDPDGVWRLFMVDSNPGPAGPAPQLNSWSLDLTFGDPRRVTDVSGAYSFDGLRPGVEHTIRETAQGGFEQTFPGGDGAQRVRLNSDQDVTGLNFGNRTSTLAPVHVTQVFVGGPGLSGGAPNTGQLAFRGAAGIDATFGYPVPDGAAQLRALPWVNGISTVALRFDQDVAAQVAQGDLVVRGSSAVLPTSGFTYDAATRTAMWALGSPVTLDKVRLVLADAGLLGLDGEWVNPSAAAPAGDTYPSGNGGVGGDFNFRLNVLRGDATGDGVVNALDLADVRRRLSRRPGDGVVGPGAYSVFSDLTMDGVVNALDLAAVRQRLGNRITILAEPL